MKGIGTIALREVLPSVFAGMEQETTVAQSQVWLRNLELTRGCRVLVSAESGTGKSSLVSFLYGRRSD